MPSDDAADEHPLDGRCEENEDGRDPRLPSDGDPTNDGPDSLKSSIEDASCEDRKDVRNFDEIRMISEPKRRHVSVDLTAAKHRTAEPPRAPHRVTRIVCERSQKITGSLC